MSQALRGTSCVVTGASRGIGLAIARRLIGEGARVVMIARGEQVLRDAAAALGSGATAIPCDVTRPDAVDAAVSRIRDELGGAPAVLVNNAGAFTIEPIESVDVSAFRQALDTNVVAPLRLTRAFLGEMRTRGSGHIVTLGSVADREIFPGNAAYAASKHGVRALHEVLRLETRGTGVRASLISPGPVDTPVWDPIDPDHREGFTPRALMLRAGAVADAVLYAITQPPDVNVDELRLSRS